MKTSNNEECTLLEHLINNRRQLSFGDPNRATGSATTWFSMLPEDWERLLNISGTYDSEERPSACILNFSCGDIIVQGGQSCPILAQVVTGSVSLTPIGSVSPTAWRGSTEFVGVVEFLVDSPSTHTIIASENGTSLCVIDTNYVKKILSKTSPLLVAKFYRHLCETMATRFRAKTQIK